MFPSRWEETAIQEKRLRIKVASLELGVQKALLLALEEFKDLALAGWVHEPGPKAKPAEPEKRIVPQMI